VRPALVAVICAALVILTFAAFGRLLSSGFISYDDPDYVAENAHVRKGLNGASVAWVFAINTETANWHPLTWLSHMLDVQLFGMDAGKHHLTSLLLHTLNGVLLFLLLFRMTGALWRSAFVAALFVLHPLHVESVAWIAERKDVLSTLFWLLTIGAWLAYVKSKRTTPYALMLVFFALGLMAKPMLVTLPFTLLLLDYWPLKRIILPLHQQSGELKKLLWEKAPLFTMSAASCGITIIAQRAGGAVQTMEQFPLAERFANAVLAYGRYLGKTFWPSSLVFFYPHTHAGLSAWAVCGTALLLVGATVLVLRLGPMAPFLPFGWLWYLGTLVPVIGLVQVGAQAMADRYTYVPLIGIFIIIAWGLAGLAERIPALRTAAPCAAAAALMALFPVTWLQTAHWASTAALFEHTVAMIPNNYLARINLGAALDQQNRTTEAMEHYRQALRINPNGLQALNNLGLDLAKMNRWPEALEYFQQGVRSYPDFADLQNNLGAALEWENRLAEALEHYQQALRIKPDDVQAMVNLGAVLTKMNRWTEALVYFQQAVRLDPDFADAQNNLGFALAHTDQTAEAIEHYQRALRIRPDSILALKNLGQAFEKTNRLAEAIERFQRAVRMDPKDADAHFHLGALLKRVGRLAEAQEHFREALRIKPGFEEARAGLEDVGKAPGSAP